MARINLDLTRMQTTYIANAVRERASDRYRDLVPLMSGGNGIAVGGAITSDDDVMVEYVKGLIALYVEPIVTKMYYENHLKRFKMSALNMGAGMLESFVPSAEGTDYDPSGADAFKPSETTFKTKKYSINSRRTFKRTIFARDIMMAFASEYGAYDMIMKLVDSIYTAAEKEEYIKMREIFTNANNEIAFPTIQAADASAKSFMLAVRGAGLNMQFPSTAYNAGGNEQVTHPDELIIFTTPQWIATVDVDLLATAFNMDKVDWISSVIVVDKLPSAINNCMALLGDYRFLKVRDTRYKWVSEYNSAGDFINVRLHKDTIYDYSPFVNMVAITHA